MQNKTVIITGASDGIGKAAARILKDEGANVVVVGRSPEKTKSVGEELGVAYYVADFSKLEEVRELGKKLRDAYPRIDVLVNNAGGLFGERTLTVDGYEKTMQVNHLSHFLLTNILLDTLIASKATIINTSSIANKYLSKLDINDLNMEKAYTQHSAYGNAKLANILFTKELQRRYGDKGIAAVSLHPGYVATNFASGTNGFMKFMYQTPLRSLVRMMTPEKGADTLVWLATTTPEKDWQPGEYYYKRKISKAHALAYDEDTARSLWEQSEKMTSATYPTYDEQTDGSE